MWRGLAAEHVGPDGPGAVVVAMTWRMSSAGTLALLWWYRGDGRRPLRVVIDVGMPMEQAHETAMGGRAIGTTVTPTSGRNSAKRDEGTQWHGDQGWRARFTTIRE